MINDQVLVMYECCRLVKGAKYGLIVDIQRELYKRIPNQIVELLENSLGKTISEVQKKYNNKYDSIIEENLNILVEEEFMFLTSVPDFFPPMNMVWKEPSTLTNSIVDIDPQLLFNFENIWKQLSELGCEHIQIRSFELIDLGELEKIINLIGNKRIISVELIIPIDASYTKQSYIDFIYRQPRVSSLILHSASKSELMFRPPQGIGHIYSVEAQIKSSNHCGNIGTEFFVINMKGYTESLAHNSCLNRKISIDTNGDIKNCPSMQDSFGNIENTTLKEAIELPGFKKYWNINKDEIHVCKECEFRYICTDCRAFVEDPNDIYSKPLKCGYNPYNGKWDEWSKNPLKEKAIEFYGIKVLT